MIHGVGLGSRRECLHRSKCIFSVIYRFELRPDQEIVYQACWDKITDYFIEHCGAVGSCLHKGEGGLWVAYSRWPDKATRDAAWPSDGKPNQAFPENIREAIQTIQKFKVKNYDLQQYDEITMDLILDKLTTNH